MKNILIVFVILVFGIFLLFRVIQNLGQNAEETVDFEELRVLDNIRKMEFFKENGVRVDDELIESTYNCLFTNFRQALNDIEKGSFKTVYATVDNLVNPCGRKIMDIIPLMPIKNDDEVKHFLPPINKNQECNIITLGIGRDVKAELKLKSKFPQCQFLGVDPDDKVSGKMYQEELEGTFIRGAIGAEDGEFNASIINKDNGNYHAETLQHISFERLINENKGNKTIDLLLMDIEGGEFGVLAHMANGIYKLPPICQINVELHDPDGYPPRGNNIMDSLFKIISHQKFLILYSHQVGPYYRMFWINVTDPKCYHSYIAN